MMKRAIRDLYNNDIDEIIVHGPEAHKEIQSFMQMFMPKHVSRVKEYTGRMPIFSKFHNVEAQIASLYSPTVTLPSGGYLVINQTEALVSIDVNSGRANKERNIEGTALSTNIEAAIEIARQLRLRNLSGLLVIDFIDMSENRHKKQVESALAEAINKDRAKVQISRISSFGLLEMSRQRLNQSFLEANTTICEHCDGRGRVRPIEASAIAVLRAVACDIEENNFEELQISGSSALMFHLLNSKREELTNLEKIATAKISLSVDETAGTDGFFMKQVKGTKKTLTPKALSTSDLPAYNTADDDIEEEEEEEAEIEVKIPQHKSNNHNNRNKHSKKNWRKNDAPVSGTISAEIATSELQPIDVSHESSLVKPNPRKKQKNKRFKNSKREDGELKAPKIVMEDTPAEYEFDQDLDKTRQQNQSLLREIWKKFVD
jgi:ribonuclease E